MEEGERPPAPHLVAAGLLGFKAVLGLWAALVALTASANQPHSFLGQAVRRRAGGVGIALLVLAAAAVAVIAGLLQARPWAPLAAYALEALAVVLALSRLGTRPGAALLSLTLSAAITGLVYAGASYARRPIADPRV